MDENEISPPISVVVVTFAGRPYLDRCVRALAPQARALGAEVLLAFDDGTRDVDGLDAILPGVGLVALPGRRTFAELRAAGVSRARGDVVAVTEDQCVPDPDWCARMLERHEQPYAAVGGAVEKGFPNGRESDGVVPWATYLCDFSRHMNPVEEGPADYLTDVNVSFKRAKLAEIPDRWEDEFRETTVSRDLLSRGETLYRGRDVVVRHQRGGSLHEQLVERFACGRLFASRRTAQLSQRARLAYAAASAGLPLILTARVVLSVVRRRRHRVALLRALPAVVLCNTSWALGELVGYVTQDAGSPEARSREGVAPAGAPGGDWREMPIACDLSVVVTVVDGGDSLRACLEALGSQRDAPALEVLVPYDSSVAGIEELTGDYDWVRWIDMGDVATLRPKAGEAGRHELFDRRRAVGLEAAGGRLVAILEDRGVPAVDWAARAVELHPRTGRGALGGAVDNGIDAPLNWAVFFCDFGRYQPPLAAGPSAWVSDVNVVYDREVLRSLRGVWSPRFHEPEVHAALAAAGFSLQLAPELVVEQRRLGLRLSTLLAERYHWGRLYGHLRVRSAPAWKRLALLLASPLLPLVLTLRLARSQYVKRRTLGRFLRCAHLVFILLTAWSVGEAMGYLTGEP